jgi:hypothetical protein
LAREIIMTGLIHIQKIREYCDYVEEHLLNINSAWDILVEKCNDMRFVYDDFYFWEIMREVIDHDLSKFSPEEFIQYQRNFFPVGEPDKGGFASAWQHHQDYNPHHWQNWTKNKDNSPCGWEINCVCMVIDWVAMGLKFNDTAEAYYEKNKERIDIPEEAVTFIYEIFERLR